MVTTTELDRRGLRYFVSVGADGTTEGAAVMDVSNATVTPAGGGETRTLAEHLRRIRQRLSALENAIAEVKEQQAGPDRGRPGKR